MALAGVPDAQAGAVSSDGGQISILGPLDPLMETTKTLQ